jgi:PAS domain S-box-containing protein
MEASSTTTDHAPSRSELAFESLPQALVVTDGEGRVERVNGAAEALFGDAVASCGRAVEEALPWLASAVRRVLAGEDDIALEAEAQTPRGPRLLAARVRRLAGGSAGAVAMVDDVSARRAVDARLRFADRIDALGALAAALAHEVNNPLSCVVAGLAFVASEHARLADALSPAQLDEASAALEEARRAALRVGRVVRSLESFGRPSAPLLAPVDAVGVVRAAVDALGKSSAAPRVSADLAGEAPVRASEPLLAEVVDALLAAAAGAAAGADPARAAIRVKAHACDGTARIIVSDNGPGAAVDVGVSVTHGIVAALGGSLFIESAPGEGTTAVVTLPLASGDA